MTIESKREYIRAIRMRYKNATKKYKSLILNEFCQVCGYTRKHAIKTLKKDPDDKGRKPGAKPTYGPEVVKHLVELWTLMRCMCSKRMVAAIPIWLPYYKREDLDEKTRYLLSRMSSSTVDRLLRPFKEKRGLSTTKTGAFVKSQIPIEVLDSKVESPGYIEADTVSHCGDSAAGEFISSLTMTDLLSGWTENRAVWTKDSTLVLERIREIRHTLPFDLKEFACDNGSEFINKNLMKYFSDFKKGRVNFTRRRPYKKNDAAHVEQKNDTHVRQLFGYRRLDEHELVKLMNDIYIYNWNPLLNFFCPVMKLKKKVRIGGKIRKVYDTPKTPYQRLMESSSLSEKQKSDLTSTLKILDPIELKKELDERLAQFNERVKILTKGECMKAG